MYFNVMTHNRALPKMKFQLSTLFTTAIYLLLLPTTLMSSTFPSCTSNVTDPDGDGYGYENSLTCTVDEETVNISASTECFDYEPIGDGWGWDGTTSCRVPINELEIIKSHFRTPLSEFFSDEVGIAATIYCPIPNMYFLLLQTGGLITVGTDNYGFGLWTTGMDAENGEILFSWSVATNDFRSEVILTENTVYSNRNRCEWVDP